MASDRTSATLNRGYFRQLLSAINDLPLSLASQFFPLVRAMHHHPGLRALSASVLEQIAHLRSRSGGDNGDGAPAEEVQADSDQVVDESSREPRQADGEAPVVDASGGDGEDGRDGGGAGARREEHAQ